MHDMIQADKGFNIRDECAARLVTLHIPPGKRGAVQLSAAAVSKTKRIANLRILVEQVIRRLKTFRVLQTEIPITMGGVWFKVMGGGTIEVFRIC